MRHGNNGSPAQPAFADWLAQVIAAKYGTAAAFGAAIGASRATVSRWLVGEFRPDEYRLRAVARVTGTAYEDLILMTRPARPPAPYGHPVLDGLRRRLDPRTSTLSEEQRERLAEAVGWLIQGCTGRPLAARLADQADRVADSG